MKLLYTIVLLLVMLVGVSFAALNAQLVAVNYYFGENSLPLSLLVVITLVVGGLIGVFASLGAVFRLQFENRCLKKQVNMAKKEVANLRALPLQDNH